MSDDKAKVCPMNIAAESSARKDGEPTQYLKCLKQHCAWWIGEDKWGRCSIAAIAKELNFFATCKAQEPTPQTVRKHIIAILEDEKK